MQQSTLDFYDQHQSPPIACGEQPQQRFEMFGAGALSDTELIAIMLHTGIRGHSVLGLASQLIAQAGSTGRSTGSHVHFEVWYHNRVVNPLAFARSHR